MICGERVIWGKGDKRAVWLAAHGPRILYRYAGNVHVTPGGWTGAMKSE